MVGVMWPHTAYLSVGSNLGDKLANCLTGIEALAAEGETRLLACSHFYRTSPVDYADQDWFVNAAVKIATSLAPEALLEKLQRIQRSLGRKADAVRFGPRVLDLDILMFDAQVICTPNLEIPHPRMHKRAFVLQPICDMNPAIIHPVLGKSFAELLSGLADDDQQVISLEKQPELLQGRVP
jgi:2-amino-4-hydroxy-6-hydroxymethyldihydropteridine diphosphokinase